MEWSRSLITDAALAALCAAVILFCVPLLRAKLGEERFRKLQGWIAIGVEAAEQLFGSGEGQRKKEWVLSLLLDRGLVKSADEVTALLESEVFRLQSK
jgi:hypothetical protein